MAKTPLAAISLILFLAACAPTAPVSRPDPVDPEQARIDAMVADGELQRAADAWLALAEREPDRAAEYQLNALELKLAERRIAPAAALIERLQDSRLSNRERHRLDLARAELALLEGDHATAGWLLASLAETLPADLSGRHAQLESRLRARLEQPTQVAFAALEQSIQRGDFEPDLALALLIDQPMAELERLLLDHGHRAELLPWLDLLVSAREFLLDPVQQEVAVTRWAERHPQAGFSAEQALMWLTAWRQSRPLPERIAVLLPGRAAMNRASAAVREGLVSAWMGLPPDRRPELLFKYIDDHPDAVISAWFELREAGIDFIIGPLERNQVDALLTLPDPGLPMLMLNHPSEQNDNGDRFGTIHAIGLLPEEEAELAAVQALVLGQKRALVLAQDSDWGRRVAGAFTRTFELGGGRVLASADYPAGQVDHSALLEVMLELDRSGQRAARLGRVLGQEIESEPQRRTDADVVFLAARAEDGLQIRPQLRFFGAGDIPLLATSQIVAGVPDPRRAEDLDGIVLPLAPWFIEGTTAAVQRQRAERLYPALDNPTLSRLHALGFDALSLVPWLDLMRRDPVLYLAGLSGRLRLPGGPLVERDLPFVRLVDGRAVPLE
jgi:uncharacterized protein